jgi:fumarate hydratase class II
MIRALGVLKLCAARANAELGELPVEVADLIARAAAEVAEGTEKSLNLVLLSLRSLRL